VAVFREVWRVLRDDGTVWLNLGDSYSGAANSGGANRNDGGPAFRVVGLEPKRGDDIKPKDLCGIPWRVAFALQADGWYLRSDIIWAKANPMPESVTNRPTRSHEYVFLLSKSERYFYDADAIREPHIRLWAANNGGSMATGYDLKARVGGHERRVSYPEPNELGANKRDVWTINSEPFPEAHFATFPKKLIEPCILAGSRPDDLVLDPFIGSGTVGEVCERFGRRWVGLELNSDYIEIANQRTAQLGLFTWRPERW
jgi:DNA modification methylase